MSKENIKNITFVGENGLKLIVKHRKSAIFFELCEENIRDFGLEDVYNINIVFKKDDFRKLYDMLLTASKESWKDFSPVECNSFKTDYYEYYDKELDNNGYLSLLRGDGKGYGIALSRPTLESLRCYKFNVSKMKSFLFDMEKQVI